MTNDFVNIYVLSTSEVEKNFDFVVSNLLPYQVEKARKFKQRNDYLLNMAGSYLVNKFTPNSKESISKFGKPFKKGVEYNVSHSGEIAVLAIAKKPVGVDIEKIKDYNKNILSKIASNQEIERTKSNGDFAVLWTLKESLLKCTGTGIDKHLDTVPAFDIRKKFYNSMEYHSKIVMLDEYVICVTLETKKDIEAIIEFVKI